MILEICECVACSGLLEQLVVACFNPKPRVVKSLEQHRHHLSSVRSTSVLVLIVLMHFCSAMLRL
jgi:hypothetical protein